MPVRAAKQAASRSGRSLEPGSGQAHTQLAPDLIFMTMRRALFIYMFAESKTLRMGIRYDIGNNVGWGACLIFNRIHLERFPKDILQHKQLNGKICRGNQ